MSAAPQASERGCPCGRPSRCPCPVPLCFLSHSVSFSSKFVTQLVTDWGKTETLNITRYRPSICKDGESWKKTEQGRGQCWTRGRTGGRDERGLPAADGRSCGSWGQAGRLPQCCRPWGRGQGAAACSPGLGSAGPVSTSLLLLAGMNGGVGPGSRPPAQEARPSRRGAANAAFLTWWAGCGK